MTLTYVDLFCGAGGASEGLRQAGLECVGAIDDWDVALASHRANHPDALHILADIDELGVVDLPRADVVWASPPCVDFSTLNPEGADPQQGLRLVRRALELILEARPRWWVLENVPSLQRHLNGYRSMEINAWQCGLPQRRRRLFWGEFPRPRLDTERTATFGDIMDGQGAKPVSQAVLLRGFREATRSRWSPQITSPVDICPTVTGSVCGTNHSRGDFMVMPEPGRIRWPTELEVRRAQGFPDDYTITGNLRERLRQIGNAVPVTVARRIGEAMMAQEAET